jgi:hypothetical protein
LTIGSNLSDEDIVEELRKILMKLESANISKEPGNHFEKLVSYSVQSLPIILTAPITPVGGLILKETWIAFEA